jgi:hypothetical protein
MGALCVRLDALLALRARALLLVQDPVALRDAGFGLLAPIFARAAADTCGAAITTGDAAERERRARTHCAAAAGESVFADGAGQRGGAAGHENEEVLFRLGEEG